MEQLVAGESRIVLEVGCHFLITDICILLKECSEKIDELARLMDLIKEVSK